MCRIEVSLNSRSSTALTNDPSDLDFLSPSHFLIHRSSFLVPEGDDSTFLDEVVLRISDIVAVPSKVEATAATSSSGRSSVYKE